MELAKFLEKNQRLQLQIQSSYIKDYIGTLPFNPWAILATWLHLRALQKLQEK